jgi:hypothetical protein
MCFGLVLNPNPWSLTTTKAHFGLGIFGLMLEYFQAY